MNEQVDILSSESYRWYNSTTVNLLLLLCISVPINVFPVNKNLDYTYLNMLCLSVIKLSLYTYMGLN